MKPGQVWHKEIGAPVDGIVEPLRLCPDAPGFFNLKPGIWAGASPPRQEPLYHTGAVVIAYYAGLRGALLDEVCRVAGITRLF